MKKLLARLRALYDEFVNTPPSEEERLRRAHGGMMENLGNHQELTAFSMVRAEEAWKDLQKEIANNEALDRQAQEFLRDGNREMAERTATLKLQSDERLQMLQTQYQDAAGKAESRVETFQETKAAVEAKTRKLPELLIEAKMVRKEEELEKKVSPFNPQSPNAAFDDVERELYVRSRMLQNKALLAADPQKQLDAQIRKVIGGKRISDYLAELARKVNSEVVDAQFTDALPASPVDSAKRLGPPSWIRGDSTDGDVQRKALPLPK